MLQFINMLMMICILASGSFIYSLEYEIRRDERRAAELTQAIAQEQDYTRLLGAEMASLATPQRIEALAKSHLPDLQPMKPQQVVDMDGLAQALRPRAAGEFLGAVPDAPPADDPIGEKLKELE